MGQQQLWFRSTLLDMEAGEANETDGPAGRQLAEWLRDRLVSEGRTVDAVTPEDWGWCVVVQRKPHRLWPHLRS